jgi:hypothetical protein
MLSCIFLSVIFLTACAYVDEGSIDYRKASISPPPPELLKNDPVLPRELVLKNLDQELPDLRINAHDSVSIRLLQANIDDCTIFEISLTKNLAGNCEIAIVVNAFEMGKGKNADFDFSPDGVRRGRLVFYSSDVSEGQALNLNTMPIYGPKTYEGGPVGFDIHIIEVDTGSEQAKALFSAVASVGSVAYPPASPVLQILDTIGNSLLSGNTDDIVFRYYATFNKPNQSAVVNPFLEAGTYVLVREQDRSVATPWNKLCYDENTGRVYVREPVPADQAPEGSTSDTSVTEEAPASGSCPADGTAKYRPYTENTYLTLQIIKNEDSKDIDLSENTFGAFRDKLEDIDEIEAQRISDAGAKIKSIVDEMVEDRQRIALFSDLRTKLTSVTGGRCSGKSEKERFAARQDAFDLLIALRKAAKTRPGAANDSQAPEGVLTESQVQYLQDGLRNLSTNSDFPTLAKFDLSGDETDDALAELLELVAPAAGVQCS